MAFLMAFARGRRCCRYLFPSGSVRYRVDHPGNDPGIWAFFGLVSAVAAIATVILPLPNALNQSVLLRAQPILDISAKCACLRLLTPSENYLMKEMRFRIARKHAKKLRWIATAVGFAVPLILSGPPCWQ